MHIPLISEYKGGFIIRRLVQTLLGGPRMILAFKTTFFAILIQATLFVLPWAVSRVLSIFIDSNEININTGMYIFGCVMGAIVFVLHTINSIVQRDTKVVSMIKPNHLLEEDEIELSKFCGLETFKFIFQRKSNWPSIILYSLISAFMCAVGLNYLRIFELNKWWNNRAIAAIIHGFGWLTICISHYSLAATNPPEPAIFAANGNFIGATFRPFYICCFLGIHCLSWKYDSWKEIDGYLHVVFVFLPLFWVLGILPPQDALLLWTGEQILCLGFGGSTTAASWWLLFTLSFSVSLTFLVHYLQSWMIISIVSACVGYVLSADLVMPLMMVFIISAYGQQSLHNKKSLLSSISIVRAFRLIWQHTENSYLDMSLVYIVSESTILSSGHSIPLTMSLLMAGIVRHRLIDVWKKLYVIAIIVFTSIANKKQRLKYSWVLLGLDVIFFPVLMIIMGLSVGLSAPLLPLFTLPVFLVGFPRPVKFWPGQVGKSAGDSLDAVYYQQMIPSLIKGLEQAFHTGRIGSVCGGDYFLARFQDRMLWLLILETGFGYCKISVKGLELQETSCHAVEALQVDEVFEQAFENKQEEKRYINENAFHTLIPYDTIMIKTYSDARNVLTGIIHNTETLAEIKEKFPKVLTWILVHFVVMHQHETKRKSQTGESVFSKRELSNEIHIERPKTTNMYKEFQTFEANKHEKDIVPTFNETWADPLHPPSVLSSWPDDDDPLEDGRSLFSPHNHVESRKSARDQVLTKHAEMTIPGLLQENGESETKIDHSSKHEILASNKYFSTSPLSLPNEWLLLSTKASFYDLKLPHFSKQWFCLTVNWMTKSIDNLKDKKDLLDESLIEMYEKLVAVCYHALSLDYILGPDIVHKVFTGIFPPSLMQEQLDQCKELRNLVLTAYRYSVKLALDECLIGPISDDDELNEYLQDYSESWHIGIDGDKQWRAAVLNQCPYLFSVGFDEIKGVYTSHLLSLQELPLYIGSLNSSLVQSIWSSLCIELLYLTNDDEERYSIQAEPTILRNLTVQAADPPLGYPVYSSMPITLSTLFW